MMLKKMVNLAVSAWMILATSACFAAEGGELGNAFISFDSKIGDYSLEYPKKWVFNDLSFTSSFTDGEASSIREASFLTVSANREGGPQTMGELRDYVKKSYPDLEWAPAKLAGLSGLESVRGEVRLVYLLRAPGDWLALRYRSAKGEQSEKVITYMLQSFRVE